MCADYMIPTTPEYTAVDGSKDGTVDGAVDGAVAEAEAGVAVLPRGAVLMVLVGYGKQSISADWPHPDYGVQREVFGLEPLK